MEDDAPCSACTARRALLDDLRTCLHKLTARELDIAVLGCKLTMEEVGELKHRSKHTITEIMRNVFRKLGVHSKIEVAVILTKCGHL